jgi:hypothetical protein
MKIVLLSLAIVLCLGTSALAQNQTPGTFETLKFDGLTLHVFTTTEGPGDISYIFETKETLVLFELPSIHHLSRQLKEYVNGLNKPIAAILVGYHVGGASYYSDIPIYASKYSVDFIDSGEEMKVRQFIASNTPDFDLEVIKPDNIVTSDKLTIAGIEFKFITPTTSPIPGMNVVIPSINAYYQHVLGAGTHPLLLSMGHIDKVIAELETQQKGNYSLFLDSHNGVEKPEAVAQKIAYLQKLKEIRQSSASETEFIEAVKTAFPDYKTGMLSGMARNLYK